MGRSQTVVLSSFGHAFNLSQIVKRRSNLPASNLHLRHRRSNPRMVGKPASSQAQEPLGSLVSKTRIGQIG